MQTHDQGRGARAGSAGQGQQHSTGAAATANPSARSAMNYAVLVQAEGDAMSECAAPEVAQQVRPPGPAFGPVVPGRDGWMIKTSTEETYRSRVAGLWRAAAQQQARASGDPDTPALIKPIDVVHYLQWRSQPQAGLAPISESTWQSYRSALLWDFARSQRPEFILACEALQALPYPSTHERRAQIDRMQDGGSRRHRRGIPKSDLHRLIDQLGAMNRHQRWGARVQYWLQAAIATGLRPREWEYARWADEDQALLLSPTLKTTADTPAIARPYRLSVARINGDSPHTETPTHLPMRAVPVEARDRIFVAQHLLAIQQARQTGFTFDDYQTYCRQTLWRACRRLWNGAKSYSLYQGRHQFAANSRSKFCREELALVMGHMNRSDGSTSSRHYAGASRAHPRSAVARQQATSAEAPIVAPQCDPQAIQVTGARTSQ